MGTFYAQQCPSSRAHSHSGHSVLCFCLAVLQSVLILLFRSLTQEAKSPFHTSTDNEPGPQVQRRASSGLSGTSNCETLQRYKTVPPWPIHNLLGTGTQEVLVYLLNAWANKCPKLFVFYILCQPSLSHTLLPSSLSWPTVSASEM